jgi:Helix-turn-helix domain
VSAVSIKQLYSIADACKRWGDVSLYTIRRHIGRGEIKTINIGSRVFIPISEVERVEQFGVGKSRKDARGGIRG